MCWPTRCARLRREMCRTIWLLFVSLVFLASRGYSQEPALRDAAGAPLRFRRIYVPADRIPPWLREKALRPVAADEFDRLIELAQSLAEDEQGATLTHIATASHSARWQNSNTLSGQSTIEIEHASPQPTLLPLGALRVAITEATWDDGQEATLGLTADGTLALLVERSGSLNLDWVQSAQPQDGSADREPKFRIGLPAAPRSSLTLDLPEDYRLVTSAPLVSEAPSAENSRRWTLELVGGREVELQILPVSRNSRHPPLVSQTTTCELSRRGAQLDVQLAIDAGAESLSSLTLALEGEQRLISANLGTEPMAWSQRFDGDGNARVEFRFPRPIRGGKHMLRIVSMAPLVLNEPWRIPAARPLDAFWESGKVSLSVRAPLTLDRLISSGMRQALVSAIPGDESGEIHEFQQHDPQGTVEVVLSVTQPTILASIGSSLILGGAGAAAESTLTLRSSGGERFQLEAEITPGWNIDDVTATPGAWLADWEATTVVGNRRILRIALARPLTKGTPLRLKVQARRAQSPVDVPLSSRELRSVQWREVSVIEEWTQLRAIGPFELQLSRAGEEASRRWESLTTTQQSLLSDQARGILFRLAQDESPPLVELKRQTPQFSAVVEQQLTLLPGSTREELRIRCIPQSAPIERLLVQPGNSSKTREWRLATAGNERLPARLLAAASESGDEQRRETWELTLPRPQTGAFEIYSRATHPLESHHAAALATVPGAAQQSGRLVVRGSPAVSFVVEADHLPPVHPRANRREEAFPVVYEWSFDPLGDPGAPVVVRRQPAQAAASCVIVAGSLESMVRPGSGGQHWLSLELQQHGETSLTLPWPVTATPREIWLQGEPVTWQVSQRQLQVNVPAAKARVPLTIVFTTESFAVLGCDRLPWPLPGLELLGAPMEWTVWLPGDHELWGSHAAGNKEVSLRQRLFGSLARDPLQPRFDPWSAADWEALWGLRSSQRQERLATLRDEVQKLLTTSPTVESLKTWGDFLSAVDQSCQGYLRIDTRELARVGVDPRSPLRGVARAAPRGDFDALLSEAGLCLVVGQRWVLLTSSAEGSRRGLTVDHGDGAMRVPTQAHELSSQMESADSTAAPRFVRVEVWKSQPGLSSRAPLRHGLGALTGWRAWELTGRQGRESHLVAPVSLRRGLLTLLGAVAGMLAFSWGRTSPRFGWGVLVGCLVGVLLAPQRLVDPTFAALAGVFAGLLVARVQQNRQTLSRGRSRSAVTRQVPSALAMVRGAVLIGTLACWSEQVGGFAAEGPSPDAVPDAGPSLVVIPLEKPDDPWSAKYYLVEEDFYQRLREQVALRGRRARGWLLDQARYRARLNWDAPRQRFLPGEVTGRFDLRVFSQRAVVTFPWSGAAETRPREASLDGQPLPITWNEEQTQGQIVVESPGRYELELAFSPNLIRAADGAVLEWAIPRTFRSRIEIHSSGQADRLQLLGEHGEWIRASEHSFTAQLGPIDTVRLRLAEGDRGQGSGAVFDVEQRDWLKLIGGSTILETRFKLRVSQGKLSQLAIVTDPRLQPIPPEVPSADFPRVEVTPGARPTARFQLVPPVTGDAEVRVLWNLHTGSSVGQLLLPALEIEGARRRQRWLAVSADPKLLELASISQEGYTPLPPAEFVKQWGAQELLPAAAWTVDRVELPFSAVVRPLSVRPRTDQQLDVTFGGDRLELEWSAQIDPRGARLFQHQLAAPAPLEIESIVVREKGVERAARWSRLPEGDIVLFLEEPIRGDQEIRLRGWLPLALSGVLPLPQINLENSDIRQRRVRVFRRPRIDVLLPPGWEPAAATAEPAEATATGLRRLVGQRLITPETLPGSLRWGPNRPTVQSRQVLSVNDLNGTWRIDFAQELNIENGWLDELRLEIPAEIDALETVGNLWKLELRPATGNTPAVATLRPARPLQGRATLQLSGRMRSTNGPRFAVPHIVNIEQIPSERTPIEPAVSERWLCLPIQVKSHPVAWDIRGLQPASLPESLADLVRIAGTHHTFQVAEDQYQATLAAASLPLGSPNILLADVCVDWQPGEGALSRVTYEILPRGRGTLDLKLPEEAELVRTTVAGEAVIPISLGDRQWRVPLVAGQLPQRLELCMRLPAGTAVDVAELTAPQVADVMVEVSSWSITGPALAGRIETGSLAPVSAQEINRSRLLAWEAILDDVLLQSSGEPILELRRWWEAWSPEVDDALRTILAAPESGAFDERELREVALRLKPKFDAMKSRVVTADDSGSPARSSPETSRIALLVAASVRGAATQHVTSIGTLSHMNVRWRTPSSGQWPWRIGLSLALAGLAVAGNIAARRWSWKPGRVSWTLLHSALGLAWWLWLSPSAAGLCWLVLAMAWGIWRWRKVPAGTSDSSLVELRAT